MSLPPLLVTLAMDADSFEHFNGLRRAHFPPERNHIPAHITLFHHLPGAHEPSVRETLARTAEGQPRFPLHTESLWMMGFGVAYRLQSGSAQQLHAVLKQSFAPWLNPQDARPHFLPHITIQNKTTAAAAKTLHAALTASFVPQTITAVGLDLWQYLGGPWQHRARFAFPEA